MINISDRSDLLVISVNHYFTFLRNISSRLTKQDATKLCLNNVGEAIAFFSVGDANKSEKKNLFDHVF